jgi:hypothetical protein
MLRDLEERAKLDLDGDSWKMENPPRPQHRERAQQDYTQDKKYRDSNSVQGFFSRGQEASLENQIRNRKKRFLLQEEEFLGSRASAPMPIQEEEMKSSGFRNLLFILLVSTIIIATAYLTWSRSYLDWEYAFKGRPAQTLEQKKAK